VKKILRTIHRWLGLLMALQLLAWMGSGLFFALSPIETIRGSHLVDEAELLAPEGLAGLISPREAWRQTAAAMGSDATLETVSLTTIEGTTWYRVAGTAAGEDFVRLVHGRTGDLAPRLGEQDARRIAQAALADVGVVESVELVTEEQPGSEFRGRALPLWLVRFTAPESLHLYVDPWSRDVVAARTTRWRIFDFLWMLHIMDYGDRDDFNTPVLQAAAALGLVIVLSGVVYWFLTSRVLRSRRQRL